MRDSFNKLTYFLIGAMSGFAAGAIVQNYISDVALSKLEVTCDDLEKTKGFPIKLDGIQYTLTCEENGKPKLSLYISDPPQYLQGEKTDGGTKYDRGIE